MKTSTDINFTQNYSCVVALGCFDGVHLGHVSVITQAKERAVSLGLPLCIWSFAEPPKRFYAKELVPLLSNAKSKSELIESLGADIYVSVKFNEEIASVPAEDFFNNILIANLNASVIVCGYDFTFGKGGTGNVNLLEKLCKENNVELISVPSVTVKDESVSSSKIREYIKNSEIEKANILLGRPYAVTAEVINGKHLGRNLGFPTINQKIDENFCKPTNGVYLTRVKLNNTSYFGITNVGTQPTVNGSDVVVETYIFDFSGYVYGQEATVEFLEFIRPETKFNSLDELIAQVNYDIDKAKSASIKYKKA